jgi:glycerol-3-phosphate acyltransferase PlsY
LLTIAGAYLMGSLPTGYLVAKAKGIDIRTVGSGNIGATNVFRILGKPAGIGVLLIDALKGWLAVAVLSRLLWEHFDSAANPSTREWFAVVAGVAAILGHNYTCWLRFKGGKGIATSAGVLGALIPATLGIVVAIWVVVFAASRYVSLASITAAAALPLVAWAMGESGVIIGITAGLSALAIYKHKSNIQRLRNGTESRLQLGSKKSKS